MSCAPPLASTIASRPFRPPSGTPSSIVSYCNAPMPAAHPYNMADATFNQKTHENNIGNLIFSTIEQRLTPREMTRPSNLMDQQIGVGSEPAKCQPPPPPQAMDQQRLAGMVEQHHPNIVAHEPNKNMRMCSVRDLMFHTIEKSLQDNSGENSGEAAVATLQRHQQINAVTASNEPPHPGLSAMPNIVPSQDVASKGKDPPPAAHESSRIVASLPRPEGLAMMAAPYAANQIARDNEYEVQVCIYLHFSWS